MAPAKTPVDEAALIAELKEAVKADVVEDANFPVDDACCRRYLRARDHDVAKATKMLRATLQWRKSFQTRTIVEDKFPVIEKEAATGKTYVTPGVDKEGRVTVLMRNRNENTKDHDGNVLHLVYQMERAVKAAAATDQESWNLVIDFAGYSLLNAPPMKTSRATLGAMQDHYPERLNKAFLVDAPWIFNAAFRAISPFIDPKTRQKIVFVKGTPAQRAAVLVEHFDLDQIEEAVGGTMPYEYSPENYLADDRAAYEAARATNADVG